MYGKSKSRIKVSLAYAGNTGIWLAGQLGKDPVTVSKWCKNAINPFYRRWQRFQICTSQHY